MPARSGPISNVLAGAFLLAGVVLAIVVSFILSGIGERFTSTNIYTVRFSVADGAAGIKPGSEVLVGGQAVGKVSAVPMVFDNDGAVTDIDVKVRIQASLRLRNDAIIYLERPLLGSLSTINIASMGSAGAEALKPGPGIWIRGRLAPPSFLAQAGFGAEQIVQLQHIISAAEKTASNLDRLLADNTAKVNQVVNDAAEMLHTVNARVPDWTGSVDRTFAHLESASAKVGPILDNANASLDDARAILADAKGAVEDARPKISNLLTSAEQAIDKLNRESIDHLNASLAKAQKALDEFTLLASDAGSLIREEAPNIRKAMANARLASDQLKLALIEVRSQPWRLLYTPSLKETETSVLYDSARNYASAVSDLRAASEALEHALATEDAKGTAQASDRQDLREYTTQLKEAFEKYKSAEKALLDRLIDRAGESAAPPADSARGTSTRADDPK